MNYFLFTSKYTDLHYEESKKYISQQYKNGDLVKVSFNDENYADYMCDSGGMEIIKETVVFVFGEDGYYYRLCKDHTEKGEKYPPGMPKRIIKQTLRLVKQVRANKKYQKNLVRRFESKTVAKLGGAAGFRRYIYLNGADAVVENYNRELAEWERKVREKGKPAEKERHAPSERESVRDQLRRLQAEGRTQKPKRKTHDRER